MLGASSATQKRIALLRPVTTMRARTIFSFTPHTTARCTGMKDAPPSCFWKYAVISNIELYSRHALSQDLLLTPPHTHSHLVGLASIQRNDISVGVHSAALGARLLQCHALAYHDIALRV